MLKKMLGYGVVLVVLVLGGFYCARNYLAEGAVESGTSYALGVETNLSSASLNLGGGGFEMQDLEINNPEGFESEYFLTMEKGMLDVEVGSILDDKVVVDSFVLAGIRLNLEQVDLKNNAKVLMDHMRSIDLGQESSGSQEFLIKEVRLRDIELTAALTAAGKKQFDKTLTIDDFTMRNLGSGEAGMTIGQITNKVIGELIKRAGGTNLTAGILGEKLNQVKSEAKEKVESEAKSQLKKLGGSLLGDGK